MAKLTAKYVSDVTRPGRYGDGGAPGLSLLVVAGTGTAGPRKSWTQRLTINGKRVDMGLGSARTGTTRYLTPTAARQKAIENHRIVREGGDPRQRDTATPGVPTFGTSLDAVIALHEPGWRSPKSAPQWRSSLATYADSLMRMPVSDIRPMHVLAVVEPIWHDKRETAKRVLQRISTVMRWAIAKGYRETNPAGDAVTIALPKNGHKRGHYRALPHEAAPDALSRVFASKRTYPGTRLALAFVMITAARSGEVRGMRWSEVDMNAATWTIPGKRMKAGREHRVPLSAPALEVLRRAQSLAGRGTGLVFPSASGKLMSDRVLSQTLKRQCVEGTVHGFRSTFRQWAAEKTDCAREVCEHALAHVVGNEAERAYQRSDLFVRRRNLMERWAEYLAGGLLI